MFTVVPLPRHWGETPQRSDFTLCEGNLCMLDTYLSSIHKKYQLVRVGNGRHRADGKTKRRKNEVNAPLAGVSACLSRVHQSRDLGADRSRGSQSQRHNPTLVRFIVSHATSPACLAHRGLATLGSIWFSLWHKWAKHSCGCLKSETGFSTLGLESGANLWEVTFKETIAITLKKLTSLLTNSKLLTWGRLMPSLVSRGFNCEGGLSYGCDERPKYIFNFLSIHFVYMCILSTCVSVDHRYV